MRYLIVVGALIAASPAAAQATGVMPSIGNRLSAGLGRETLDNSRLQHERQPWDTPAGKTMTGDDGIQRAALWGECVRHAAPAESLAYLRSPHHRWSDPAHVHAVFETCRSTVGGFGYDHRPMVLRAAIADAWRQGGTTER